MKHVLYFLKKTYEEQLFLKITALLCAFGLLFAPSLFADAVRAENEEAAIYGAVDPTFFIIPAEGGYFYGVDHKNGTAELLLAPNDVQRIEIPEIVVKNGVEYTVTSVSAGAFAQNTALWEIILPKTVLHIGSGAFFGCVSLESITAEGLSSAGTDVFGGTPFITSSEFVTLGKVLFRYNGEGEAVKVPAGVSFVADAFAYNPFVNTVILPEGICEVGDGAFACAENLKTAILPFSLEKIGSKAFFACINLKEISIASNVISIGESAFSGTPFMAELLECDGDMIILGGGVLLKYKGSESSVTVPEGVVSISDAFAFSSVKSVTLPNGCSIGESAFKDAKSLSRVTVEGNCGGISAFAFEGCGSLTFISFSGNFTGSVEKLAFKGSPANLSVYHKNGMKGFEAFENVGITAVSPEKIK